MDVYPEPEQPFGSWKAFDVTAPCREHLLASTRANWVYNLSSLGKRKIETITGMSKLIYVDRRLKMLSELIIGIR